LKSANLFKGLSLFGVVASMTLVSPPNARGQSAHTCDEGRPFTAQTVLQVANWGSDGIEYKQEFDGVTARDSWGRVYSESHKVPVETPKTHAEPTVGSGIDFGHGSVPVIGSIVRILDCRNRTLITVSPDLKTARTTKNSNGWPWLQKTSASLFEVLTSAPRPPDVVFEDLGFKEVEGITTHGYSETYLGAEDDGERNGKAKSVTETWVSDDLAEVMLYVQMDTGPNSKREIRIMLANVRQEEPDASLFEIPAEYKTESSPEQMRPSGAPLNAQTPQQ
jgi:hypothetical protein